MALPALITGLVGKLIGNAPQIGSGIANIMDKKNERIKIQSGDVAQNATELHEETMSILNAHVEELKVTGGWIDTMGRLPRPTIALLTIAYLVYFVFNPVKGMAIAQAMASIPDSMWYIIMGVFGFYFTFHTVERINDSRKTLSKEEYNNILARVQDVGFTQSEKIVTAVKEQTAAIKSITDKNGDGLDDDLVERIKVYEGYKDSLYKCAQGFNTIGYGTNLDAGIDKVEAEFLLIHRIKKAQNDIERMRPEVQQLNNNRKNAIIDMTYNMGAASFTRWETFFLAIKESRFQDASKIIRESKYAKQVGKRAKDNALLIEKG